MQAKLKFAAALLFTLAFAANTSAQKFAISPSGKINLCDGDTLTLSATAGFAKYQWSNRATTRTIKVTKGGTYACAAADKSGNVFGDTVYVNLLSPTKPQLSYNPSNRIVCAGDSLVIEVGNKFQSMIWSNGAKGNRVVIKPKASGKITLKTKDANGCSLETVIQYTVKNCSGSSSCPDIVSAYPDSILCGSRDSAILEAKSGYASYLWNDGDKNRIKTVKKAGTYILKTTDKNGNHCYDTVVIKGSSLTLKIEATSREICKGDSVKLIASAGFQSYKWSNGNTNRYFWDKPSKTTNYLVFAKDQYGCEYIEDMSVKVKTCDSCDDLIGASKMALCGDKDTVTLEGKSGYKTYKWSTGIKDRVVKVTSKGWYVLTTTDASGNTCTDSIYINKGGKTLKAYTNPNPPIVCPGDKVGIELTSGFKSYWWNTGNRGDYAYFYPTKTKEIVIEAVDSNGCESRTTVKIIVKDTCKKKCPEIIETWPRATICDGDSVKLLASTGYKSYKWSTGSSDRYIYVKKEGWYWVDFKDGDGNECRDSIYIKSGSTKKLDITIVPGKPWCIGDTVAAYASSGFKTYGWNISTSFNRVAVLVLEKKKTKVVVEATDSNGCDARKEIYVEADSCNSSVDQISRPTFDLTPNPASDIISVTSQTPIQEVVIYSISGEKIKTEEINDLSDYVSVSELPDGIYTLEVWFDDYVARTKFIKQSE